MPSIDAPGHYERSSGILHEKHDEFLRWLDPDEFVAETSRVDSPLGWVGLLKLEQDTIATWLASAEHPHELEPGWYIVKVDESGIVWGMTYGEDCVYNEERARADFAEAEAAYAAWEADVEGDWLG